MASALDTPYEGLQRNIEDMQKKMDNFIVETKQMLIDQKLEGTNEQRAYHNNELMAMRPTAPNRGDVQFLIPVDTSNGGRPQLLQDARGITFSRKRRPMTMGLFCRMLLVHIIFFATLGCKIYRLVHEIEIIPKKCEVNLKVDAECLAMLFVASAEEVLFTFALLVLAEFYGLLFTLDVAKEVQIIAGLKQKAWEQDASRLKKFSTLARSYLFAFVKYAAFLLWGFFIFYVLLRFALGFFILAAYFVTFICLIFYGALILFEKFASELAYRFF